MQMIILYWKYWKSSPKLLSLTLNTINNCMSIYKQNAEIDKKQLTAFNK